MLGGVGAAKAAFLVLSLVVVLSLLQKPAHAACQTCESGSTESAESGSTYCNCWPNSYEECSDPFTKSTVTTLGKGACWLSCPAQTGTDYCEDSGTLKEAYLDCYCCDEVKWKTIKCSDYGSYKCSSGKCVYDACIGVTCNDYCAAGNVRKYNGYCSSGSCVYSSYDCDNGDGWICDSGNVKKYKDYYCSGGSCLYSYSGDYDCDDSDGWYNSGSSYKCCSGSSACTCQDQNYRDYYCSSGGCSYSTTNTRTTTSGCASCPYKCESGACKSTPMITFQGVVRYYDREEQKYKPLPGVKFELWDNDPYAPDEKIASGETNSLGGFRVDNIDTEYYDLDMDDAADIYVKVIMESSIAAVSEAWDPTIISHESSMYDNVMTDKDVTVDIGSSSSPHYEPESGAANVMDVVRGNYQLYKSYDPDWTRSQVFIELHDSIGLSYYEKMPDIPLLNKKEIHLYDNWIGAHEMWMDNTISHEYAHAVMYETYGNKLPPGGGGIHAIWSEEIYADDRWMPGNSGFALIEGWAEFMEAVMTGKDSVADISPCDKEGDGTHGNCNLINDSGWDTNCTGDTCYYNIEKNEWWMGGDYEPDNTGAIVEGAIASIFWDIYDSNNTDELNGGGISDGFSKIWSIVREDHPNSILEFWDRWFSTNDSTPTNYGDFNKTAYIYEMHGIDKCPDSDGDGYDTKGCGGGDCNDANSAIKPGAAEQCDYADNDCDGTTDEGCTVACYSKSDCGTDGWTGSAYCSSDDIWQGYRTWTCNNPGKYNSYCTYSDSAQSKEECSTDSCGSWGSNYCKNGDVYRSRTCHDRGCSGGACYDSSYTDEQLVQTCANGCANGQCNQPACPSGWSPCPSPRPQDCTDLYSPACGYDGQTNTTYSNSCYACAEGTTSICYKGGLCIPGDADWNNRVDIFDLAAVGLCYEKTPSGSCQKADINNDGTVNIFDLASVGLNYGKSY